MSTHQYVPPGPDVREYLLAEFRCAVVKAKLARYDIEAVALALKFKLVSPEQAVEMFWNCEAIRFIGVDIGVPPQNAQEPQQGENAGRDSARAFG